MGPNPVWLLSLEEEKIWTQSHVWLRGKMMWRDTETRCPSISQGEGPGSDFPLTALRKDQPCWYLSFGLVALELWIINKCITVIEATWFMVPCYSCPTKISEKTCKRRKIHKAGCGDEQVGLVQLAWNIRRKGRNKTKKTAIHYLTLQ